MVLGPGGDEREVWKVMEQERKLRRIGLPLIPVLTFFVNRTFPPTTHHQSL